MKPEWHGNFRDIQEPDENGWQIIGYKEKGNPIQRNVNTGKIRILTEWVEIFRIPLTV